MRIRILHETCYTYEEPARAILQHLRLTPKDHEGQHVIRWRIDPGAEGRLTCGSDHFGNVVHVFAADEPLRELRIRAEGEVEATDTAGIVRNAVEAVPDGFFLRETSLTACDERIGAFADDLADPSGDVLSTLHALLREVNGSVRFDVAPTHSGTTAAQAFELGRGVCQDLTHIFLAAARHLDIPSRYVSGYFRRADGVVDQEAGHAWAEAKVPDLGWVGFDPANGIAATDAHVRVAIGLDYHGAAPIRGSRRGGGKEKLDVRLSVDTAPPSPPRGRQSQVQRQG